MVMNETNSSDNKIYWLDSAPDTPSLGGKARSLARLSAAGLPVPPGFVLAAEALPADEPAIPGQPLPAEAAAALTQAYGELGQRLGQEDPLVAVRSSGLAEDLAQASFAGQYVTVLGVRGAADLLTAARRCWASLWMPGVKAYRAAIEERTGQKLPPPGMAILVQSLLPAEAAGVAETSDTLTGSQSAVIIRASWGLGRAVVDGLAEPDTWRVERESLAVLDFHVGDKSRRAGIGLDALPEPVDESQRRRPCLSAEQAVEIARLALKTEFITNGPADVEWAFADDKIWLLQARPLVVGAATSDGNVPVETAAGPSASNPGFPFVWPDAEMAKYHWQRKADDARVFEALPPFELDARVVNVRSMAYAEWLRGDAEQSRCLEVNGYIYNTRTPALGSDEDRVRRTESYWRTLRAFHARGETYFSSVILPEVQSDTHRLEAIDPASLSHEGLADHFDEVFRWYDRAWSLHMMMDPFDELSPAGRASKIYSQITGDENPWAIYAPFSHVPQKDHEALESLIVLAQFINESPALKAVFETENPEKILGSLNVILDGVSFRKRLDAFLDEFGLQCGASQGIMRSQVMPSWREEPALVITILQLYLLQDLSSLLDTRRHSEQQYIQDIEQLKAKVAAIGTPDQVEQFNFWYDAAERQIIGVVNHNHFIDSPINALLHRALMACGKRLAEAGVIEVATDIWFLRAYQIAAAVRSLSATDRPDWSQLVLAHKALFTWQRSLTPPFYLGQPPAAPVSQPPERETEGELPANLLVKGIGAAPGVATGRVRFTDYRALVPDIRPGDVFVAPDCGVLWASILPVVSAVVLDGSYPGEHPMRVCTEFGIPGIVQAKTATQVLREGQLVTVDGGRGWVLAVE